MVELALTIVLVFLILAVAFWRFDKASWDEERQMLLDRIQARSLGEVGAARAVQQQMYRSRQGPAEEEEPEEPKSPVTVGGVDGATYESMREVEAVARAGRIRYIG